MTRRDAASRCSFPLSRISPLKAVAGTGGWWEDPSSPVRASEMRARPASLRKPLRSQKEKQSIAERLGLGFTLVAGKSPLGYYLGRPVPSKTCSFHRSLPGEASLGVARQPAMASPNTIASHGASARVWLASATLRTGRATEQAQLGGSRIRPAKPALSGARPVPSPRAAMPFEPPRSATREPKPTSRRKLALIKEAVEARRVQLAEWQAAKGKVLKRPPFVLVTAPPRRFLSKEPPAQSSWTTIPDEEETRLEPDQGSLAISEQPSPAGGGAHREEVVAPGDPTTQGAQALVEHRNHLQQPAGAAGNTHPAGKGTQPLADEQCQSAGAVDNGKRALHTSALQVSVWKRPAKQPCPVPHLPSRAAK
ncbi:cytoskeleton-associated protein 2-like [Emydura macquarii macquarii]|uniref:cytoskeleton-associated protein 2-like n=1 Tax=Emydura macquarii macquarii TaxID=1129001 RepID=UPI00352AA19F